jgi:transcriptional regulator with XRE-family HTH domain
MSEQSPILILRTKMGLSQADFGALIGVRGKSSVSELENNGRASLPVALQLEKLGGLHGVAIDAAALNEGIAAARDGMVRPSWMLTDAEIDALPGGSDAEPCFDAAGDAADAEAFDRVIICDVCETRVDAKRACAFVDCPHRRELAA